MQPAPHDPGHHAPPTDPPRSAADSALRATGRAKAVMMIVTLVVLFAASLFVAPLLGGVLRDNGVKPESGAAALFLSYPWLTLPLSLPSLWACIRLVRGADRPFLWMLAATLLALLPLAFFLVGAVSAIAELYNAALRI
ncbi:MAG: hypothetical protein ACKOYN_06885 [Planctomycetota bacterium]